jgi:hypothetical protein
MGRRRIFTDEQVQAIQDDPRHYKDIAREFGVTLLTIGKVKRKEGAYAELPRIPDNPVLDQHGIITNPILPDTFTPDESFIPFLPPIRHD